MFQPTECEQGLLICHRPSLFMFYKCSSVKKTINPVAQHVNLALYDNNLGFFIFNRVPVSLPRIARAVICYGMYAV